ncbi:MAG: dihydrouridine synthase DuS [Acidobacteriales bacterium]|nr:dihydrouridine synthase DuS [Terriglobales bacterium]
MNPENRSRAERFHEAEPLSAGATANAVLPDEVVIGGVRIAPATILAPMAGVTDTVFRRFIKHSSFDPNGADAVSACGLIMTEFTSADGIFRCREAKRKRYLHFYEDEHPISAQLFGSKPEILAGAAKIVEECGFDIVDLNLGCPAKKVVKCNGGSGLLRDLPHIKTIFEMVRAAVKIPFTVKFRMGWDDSEIVCVELAKLAENCGLNAVALHARTREQGYSGNARWEWIAAIKDAVRIPVIGNGDIRSPEDAALMVARTGCDAVMIGRTAPSNPWIFRQIAQYKASLQATGVGSYEHPTEMDRYQMMRKYFEMLIAEEVPAAAGKMKQFASWFTHGVPGGAVLRKAIYQAKSERAVLDSVDEFFAARQNSVGAAGDSIREEGELESMPYASCG